MGGVTGIDELSKHFVTHEILHTLGMAHPSLTTLDTDGDGPPQSIVVPGTSAANDVRSVLQEVCGTPVNCAVASPPLCCNSTNDLSVDDKLTIDRLYSPVSGGNCNCIDDYRTIQ